MAIDTIKQHYVPQFYLKNFSNKKNNTCFLNCYDIIKNRQYYVNIKDIAQEHFFYKINNQNFEDKFQRIEKPASDIINNLTKNKNYKLLNNINNRFYLSLFMSCQYLRTKEMRETVDELDLQLTEYLKNHDLNYELKKYLNYLTDSSIKNRHKDVFESSLNKISFNLFMKKWVILNNTTDRNFYTSDNPLVRYNPIGKMGFACDYIQVYYPINPRIMLCLIDPFNYKKIPKNFKIQKINKKQKNPHNTFRSNIYKIVNSKITDVKLVDQLNILQFKNATRHVFSKDENFIINNNFKMNNEKGNRVILEKINIDSKEILHIYSPD